MSLLKKKQKFFSLDRLDSTQAQYRIAIGERSNGKTYACLKRILENYVKNGKQGAIIRRYSDDFKGKRGATMWDGLVTNKEVRNITGGKWDEIYYYSGRWYLQKFDEDLNKYVRDETPIAYAFALNTMEHDKSTSYPNITTVLFDEFLTRSYYLPDEFVTFMNVLSTIIRFRDDVVIYMMANTVNKSAPYFKEMGITRISEMKQGDMRIYQYGENNELTVAIEYCDNINRGGKPSDRYFAFDNPKLKMITGGSWEMCIYPHLPYKYKDKDIQFTYFIKWEEFILQCEIIHCNDTFFTYIHYKTTPIKDESKDLIYCPEYDPRLNWSRKITKARTKREDKIQWFFKHDAVYYQDNEVGEIVRNYLQWCRTAE